MVLFLLGYPKDQLFLQPQSQMGHEKITHWAVVCQDIYKKLKERKYEVKDGYVTRKKNQLRSTKCFLEYTKSLIWYYKLIFYDEKDKLARSTILGDLEYLIDTEFEGLLSP